MNLSQWKDECNQLLLERGWRIYALNEIRKAEPIPKVDLFLIIRSEESQPNSMLDLKEFGVIGLVKQRKVLDNELLQSFQNFLTDGYETDNTWWKSGKFDKVAMFGILIKKGKSTLKELLYQHAISPTLILKDYEPVLVCNAFLAAEKKHQCKLSDNQLFAGILTQKLEIELMPQFSDVANMHFRIATRSAGYGQNEACLQLQRLQAFLTAIFAFQHFTKQYRLSIVFRNNFLNGDRFLVENSKLHTILINRKAMELFNNQLFGESVDVEVLKIQIKEKPASERILAFIQSHESERLTSARPIDK